MKRHHTVGESEAGINSYSWRVRGWNQKLQLVSQRLKSIVTVGESEVEINSYSW